MTHTTISIMSTDKLFIAGKAPLVAYPALIAAELNSNNVTIEPVDSDSVENESTVLGLVKGSRAVTESLCEPDREWSDLAFGPLSGKNFKELQPKLNDLDLFLNFRSFLSGYKPGPNDVVVWGVLRANGVVAASVKNGTYVNIARWYKYLDENQIFGGSVAKLTADLTELRKQANVGKKKESKASFDIGLPDAVDGKVVTRFPPEPSGYLHIGHAKAAILNQYFAEMYHGKLIIRFDDTNPSKEKEEFTDSILEDLELLGIKGDSLTYSSDYFDEMYALALKLIKEGKAYVDDTPVDQMREERGAGIKSGRRDRSIEENLRVFDEMKKGSDEGVRNCLRAKISVDANNKTLRDPVIYRCNPTPHARTGDKWKMYPTYDFCCPVVDSIEGVTHALRTIEYRDRNEQYEWMLKALNLRHVHVWDFSRINFVRTLLSKRKLQWFVDNNKVSGWDDPRFPTVRGVRRRGMTVEGLRQFIISQGPSKNILNLDWSLIWAVNKRVIDPVAPRYVAVQEPTPFILSDDVKVRSEKKPLHKKNPEVGTKTVLFSNKLIIDQADALTLKDGEELTLMDWGNAVVDKIVKDASGNVSQIQAHLHLNGDFRSTEHKLTWLADTPDLTPVELVNFDHLISKEKIEEGENFEDYLTADTVFRSKALADLNLRDLPKDTVLQFERKGYFKVDDAFNGAEVVLFAIPDGKVVSRYGAKPSEKK